MFLKVVIYRNVAFTHSNTQKDITELKRKHAICLGVGQVTNFNSILLQFVLMFSPTFHKNVLKVAWINLGVTHQVLSQCFATWITCLSCQLSECI